MQTPRSVVIDLVRIAYGTRRAYTKREQRKKQAYARRIAFAMRHDERVKQEEENVKM